MVLLYGIGFLMIAGLVGSLFLLRRNPQVSKQFDRFNTNLAGSSRWRSFECFFGGLFLAGTAIFRRVDAGQGEFRLIRSEQPGYLLLGIAIYFMLVGLLFFIRPAHVSKFCEGLGAVSLGIFLCMTAVIVFSGGGTLVSLYGAGVDDLFSKYPLVLIVIAAAIGSGGIMNIRYFFRERAMRRL